MRKCSEETGSQTASTGGERSSSSCRNRIYILWPPSKQPCRNWSGSAVCVCTDTGFRMSMSCWSGTATVPAGSRICAGWRTDGPEISGSGSVPPDGCPARICPFRTPDWPSRAWTPGRTLPCTNPCGWRSCWGVFRKRLRTPICKNVWTDWMKPTESCCDFILPAKCP